MRVVFYHIYETEYLKFRYTMENGEWRMENGEWKVDNGQLTME